MEEKIDSALEQEPEQTPGLSITIENIKFTLIYKTTTYTNAIYEEIYTKPPYNLQPIKEELSIVVKIHSINLTTKDEDIFWVYLSFSELGVWRFACYDRPNSISYDKGKEYIQSTCINMDLQKHIHLCYDRLDEIISSPENPHVDIINTPQRKQPGFASIIDQNINLSQKYINKNLPIIHSSNREKYIILEKDLPIKCGMTVKYSEQDVLRQIQTTSQYLEVNYDILDHEKLFHYNFVFRNVINSENIVIKVTLKNKNTNEIIILFYKKMFFSKLEPFLPIAGISPQKQANYNAIIDKITSPGNQHFVVILVVPSTAHCLNNSLYSEYIHLGVYVCKPFDYTRYLGSSIMECTKDYSYIANRYENIFPIKYIESQPISQDEKAGGKFKKHTRRRKYKKSKKYKKHTKHTKGRKYTKK